MNTRQQLDECFRVLVGMEPYIRIKQYLKGMTNEEDRQAAVKYVRVLVNNELAAYCEELKAGKKAG
jgi:hypothetical protein